jgi:hypothetical protein
MAAYTVNTYAVTSRAGLNQEIGTTSATQLHDLGTRITAKDVSGTRGDAEFIYLKGVASTVVGSVVLIKDDYSTSLVAARDKGALALATAAIVANQYGWYQIKGVGVCAVGTIVANAPLYIAAAGAILDDLAVAGDQVIGCRSQTATDTATALVLMACNPATADFDNA